MNYLLTATMENNGDFQSVIVKLKGARGQMFPQMRSWALALRDTALSGQTEAQFKSMNYTTKPSEINELLYPDNMNADIRFVIKWREDNSVNNDFGRSTIIKVENTNKTDFVNDMKAKWLEVTGSAYDDTKLFVSNMVVELKKP